MTEAIVNKPILSVYERPNCNSERVDELIFGMIVHIIEYSNENWVYIETSYKYKGYVELSSIHIAKDDNWQKSINTIVNINFLDILCEPKIQSSLITYTPRGSFLIDTNEKSKDKLWTKVMLPTGIYGWVITNNLKQIRKFESFTEYEFRTELVKDATSYLNTQYRWGGKTPLGIDCSGLCSIVYLMNDVLIFRDADIVDGFPIKEISLDRIQKGDLIFFPGHVAMYLGNNKYIHSSQSGNGVKINSLCSKDLDYRHDLASTITKVGSIF